ncbi:sugar transporter ERD6-like 4 [Contarinia nasturtii]|uniref:sugar transporter ERD6-like 4 n=1 Tax=Contarinia nasturtii TaxID=265458 RepID=UPI0012D3C86B|nr:sugar transporter ERD6-like 4 [Contarinia nasturtii]
MLPRGFHIHLQFFSTIFGNLLNLTYGLTIGWICIYGNKFHTDSNPLQVPSLNSIELKWIDLSLYIGALIGTVFLTIAGDVFGRKYTLVVLIVPQASAFLLKMLATNATELYIGRFLSGFTAGGSINLIVLYVAELADDKFRGRLNSILPFSITLGTLIIFTSDMFLSFFKIASISLVILTLFLCTYTFFPDTPRQLYKIRRKEQAIQSLQIYRDIRDLEFQTDDCYLIEVKKLRRILKKERGCTFEKNGRATTKSFIISIALIMLNVYVNWFVQFHLTWHPLLDTKILGVGTFRIVIAACQLSGSLLCLLLVDFIERKLLLLVSIFGITLSHIIYVIFVNSRDQTTLPILFVAIAAFSLHFGVYPLTFVLIPEIIQEKIRIYGITFMSCLMWLLMLSFSCVEWTIFNLLNNDTYVGLIIPIIFNIICFVIFSIYVPPTKKKSYHEIFTHLNLGVE